MVTVNKTVEQGTKEKVFFKTDPKLIKEAVDKDDYETVKRDDDDFYATEGTLERLKVKAADGEKVFFEARHTVVIKNEDGLVWEYFPESDFVSMR